ncbi:MAG: glycosyltransferase family 9 protein [Pseudomonadota bacterium]
MSSDRTAFKRRINPGVSAKRVLIIKLSALGDFVLALGAIRTVREAHPAARITLLTTPSFKTFAEKCPYIDVVETDGRPDGIGPTRELIKRIRKEKYNIVYDFQTSGRTANYFKALNMPGRKPPLWSGHADNAAFKHENPNRGSMHSIDRLAEQLSDAGLGPEGGYTPETIPMPDLSWIPAALGHRPSLSPAYFGIQETEDFALIIPGASEQHPEKMWPANHFGEVARLIADTGLKPVLIGAKAEGQIAAAIQKAEPRVINLVTRTDLFQIATLAARARFVIGNDTGPMHMATLAGAPGVALFATNVSDPDQAAPRGPKPVVVVHGPTLDQVAPRDVWQAVKALGVLGTAHSA